MPPRKMMGKKILLWSACLMVLLAVSVAAQQKSEMLESIVARVNNDIITRSDLDRAQEAIHEEALQDCATCTPAQIDEKVAAQQKDLLRSLIDNSLLVQRAQDLGINVDTDVIRRLDEIRQANKIASMEDLEKRVTESGQDFEEFKKSLQEQILRQEAIRREVSPKVIVDHSEILKFYEAHKAEFVRPELVVVREIFVSSEGKTEAEIPALRKKADGLLERVKNGDDFGELAKHFSDSPTAKDGGSLGPGYERGQMAPELENIVFKMKRNEVTDVLPTKTGFLILQVQEHYAAGQQPEDKVDEVISNEIYNQKLQPALRQYLTTLRQDSYIKVQPGYVDTAAVAETPIEEVPATPDKIENKTKKKNSRGLDPSDQKKIGA